MASTHRRSASGSQGGFALVLAVAAFTASLFLWADARAETVLPETPASSEAPV